MQFSSKYLQDAHAHCTSNESELRDSEQCGCFYCLHTFTPDVIAEWIDDKNRKTAICPFCGIDSVIGSASNLPITNHEFLEEMHKVWF